MGSLVFRVALFVACLVPWASAQVAVVDKGRVLTEARKRPLAPRETQLVWMDWARVKSGISFYRQNKPLIDQILATASLVSTYAAKDVLPPLEKTKRLETDYNRRLAETGAWMEEILTPVPTLSDFRAKNLRRAYDLGQMHFGLSKTITAESLGWSPKERVTFNQQAYAFVLYTFAWQPIETMLAMGKLDEYQDYDRISDWLHLWCAIGYAMGVEESLLPRSYSDAKAYAALLRRAQYAKPGEPVPAGINVLLKGELKMLAPQPGRMDAAIQALTQMIHTSPGLTEALGLGKDTAGRLRELMSPEAK